MLRIGYLANLRSKKEYNQFHAMTRKLSAYLLATLLTYVVSAILVSQLNLYQITQMGWQVEWTQRINAAWNDVIHMWDIFLPSLGFALLLGFLFTGLVLNRFIKPTYWLYALAGFTAILAMHLILEFAVGFAPIAPAREFGGLVALALVGALAGLIYHHRASS